MQSSIWIKAKNVNRWYQEAHKGELINRLLEEHWAKLDATSASSVAPKGKLPGPGVATTD